MPGILKYKSTSKNKKKTYFGVKFEKNSIGRRSTAKSCQTKKYLGYTLF